MASGAAGTVINDFAGDNFDHGGLGFIGGAFIGATNTNGRPIQYHPVPPATPRWGAAWKQAVRIDPENAQALWSLSRALRPLDAAEAARLMNKYAAVQKERRIIDRAETLANDAVASMQAQDWPEAIPHLKQAIAACGECSVRAERHKKLGLMHCHAGHLDSGEKELRLAQAAKPDDPEVERALALIAQARKPATEARSKTGAR